MSQTKLQKAIKEYREKNGLSLHALAKKAGVDVSNIYRYEIGENIPNTKNLSLISKAIGVPFEELI